MFLLIALLLVALTSTPVLVRRRLHGRATRRFAVAVAERRFEEAETIADRYFSVSGAVR
ncbi:hypothetical protein [Motilibacter deserti]|uniref:Uncharacterized protein n=1 Tax=Motilibacter deserti TaxID=2714956 RepID=A0ABX0GWA2_9ACTN|nr:hypothetical protein [Motilibacter deserti]NHC15082.1 hypothetical protein [Motilibacter deserti]